MKTKFLFAALAAAAMTACSTDEVVDVNKGNAISFRTSVDKATRTTVYSSTSLMEKFKVTAIGNSATYFSDLVVTKGTEETTTTWTTASTYYWPNYNLSFYAYAPTEINSTSSATVSITNNAQTISDFKPTSKVANQQDLVVALAKDQTSSTSAVALNFKHALSQVDVKAQCTRTDVQVKVLGVKLVNVKNTGTFTFPTATTSNDATISSQWAAGETTASYMSGVSEAVTLTKGESTTTATSIMASNDHFLMIPQTLTAGSVSGSSITGAYISVLCQISVKQGESEDYTSFFPSSSDDSKYAFAAVPLSGTWEAGKKYTYTLSFGGSDGTGGCGYVDLTQEIPSGSDYSTPDGSSLDSGASSNAGNKILGNAISFSVSVENWTDGTVTEPTM